MAKSKTNYSNPLYLKYNSVPGVLKSKTRDKIMQETGISLPHFYYILRSGKAQKLAREVFAKRLHASVNELFPQTQNND